MIEIPVLLIKTIVLRPYVFVFLAAFLFAAHRLLGWQRTLAFFGLTWMTAFACEFASTRTGFPFGWYFYTGTTVGEELYLSNVPFMDSLSFTFLLFSSYCLALWFLLPAHATSSPTRRWRGPVLSFDLPDRTGWPVMFLTVMFFAFIDTVIDPVALRGDRWFLGRIYLYPEPGVHFGVPIANYIGWAVVGTIALALYFPLDWYLSPRAGDLPAVTGAVLLGCGLYCGVLAFNLTMTFWINEPLLGTTGLLIFIPITALAVLRGLGYGITTVPSPATSTEAEPRNPGGTR